MTSQQQTGRRSVVENGGPGRTDLEEIQDQLEFLNDAHDEQQK
jgi:hypothetical protein